MYSLQYSALAYKLVRLKSNSNMQKIEYIKISKLKGSPINPRKIDRDQFQKLCDSIEENQLYFETRPILCNAQYEVFAGNMRLRAAKKLGMKEVPCAVMDISEEKQKELMIRDNVSNGEWDISLLTAEFETEDLESYGVNLEAMGVYTDTGFDSDVSLPSGEKSEFTQMTFTLSTEQAETIKNAIEEGKHIAEEYDHMGNQNKNGNALYAIIREWLKLKI